MPAATTEKLHDKAPGLDMQPMEEVAALLAAGQIDAAGVVPAAAEALAAGARAMAEALQNGGRLWYAGAGSSGLMAAADALELGGTFGIAPERVRILMAGGLPASATMPGATEDDTQGLDEALAELTAADTVIAVAASGTTPYTLAVADRARARGATVVALANNPGAPLFDLADIAVLLATPPEVISGSTRLGAGTAQKIALNTMSTLMGVALGHIYDGMMVAVVADNAKLRARAAGIVGRITGADAAATQTALAAADGNVKAATLIAAGAGSPDAARALLDTARGHLRQALETLRNPTRS
ncbi:MAG: N-acetylmuramic acid 6-phosphate etherase [Maritimibacter sp.]|nr:N-acetylmuramic acid 6-phosphate etherase [Maritimibacter sp.]